MNSKSKFALGVFTALAMMLLTYALPRGGALRDASLVQFPMTGRRVGDFRVAVCEAEVEAKA
jgi:hypothetical protein